MGSQPGGANETPVVDYVAVALMLVGATLIGVAMPLTSWLLGIIGGVLFLVGAGIGLAYGIMEHTEDYELRPREPEPSSEETGEQHARRIISA